MSRATACSAAGIRATRRFLGAHGPALGRVAVVGRGFSLVSVRALVRIARLGKVRVFGDEAEARRWLAEG